jgi:archaellum component FlaG (FlaF/FlaG flagellin family)
VFFLRQKPSKTLLFALIVLAISICTAPISTALEDSRSIEVKEVHELEAHFYPGEQNSWILTITNKEDEACNITVTETHKFPLRVYMLASIGGLPYTFGERFSIKPGQALPLNITVVAPGDAGTGRVKITVTIIATLPLSVTISPRSATLDVGQSQLFTSTVKDGASPYSYQWYLNGAPVSGATKPTWKFTPTSAGSYTIYVKVTDSAGVQAMSNTATVTVNAALSVTISPNSVTLDIGQSQLFTSIVTGGESPYTYRWYVNGHSVSSDKNPNWTFTPTAAGSYTIYVKVTDSLGMEAASSTANVTVNGQLSVSISPSSVDIVVGQSKLFTSTVSGGTSPYSYQWYLNNAPVFGATSSTWTFTPKSPGSYTIYVKVTDRLGTQATSNPAVAHVKSK